MQSFFVSLNSYLARRKRIFFLLFILCLVVAGYIASGVRLEENLNAIIPEDQRISKISAVFDKSELADQLVFILSFQDTSQINPLSLIEKAERLVDLLEKDTALVNEIRFKMGGDAMLGVYDFIYNNLPLFLTDEDYLEIGKLLSAEAIENTIKKDFKTLISPAGMATKDFILRDPLNLTPMALKKLDQFQLDDNFILHHSAIFTKDKANLLFFLDPVYPSSNTKENLKLIEFINHTIERLGDTADGITMEYYGGTAVAVANSVRVKKDIILTVSIALGFFLLVFFTFFRRFRVIVLMFVPVVIGAGISVAMLTLLYGMVSAIALGVGVIFIGITVDYSLHLFTHIRAGGSVSETMQQDHQACTDEQPHHCIGISLPFGGQIGGHEPDRDFCRFCSCYICTVCPGHHSLTHRKEKQHVRQKENRDWTRFIEKAVGYSFEKNRVLIFLILLLTILFAFTSQKIRFNGDISVLNYQTKQLAAPKPNSNPSVR